MLVYFEFLRIENWVVVCECVEWRRTSVVTVLTLRMVHVMFLCRSLVGDGLRTFVCVG